MTLVELSHQQQLLVQLHQYPILLANRPLNTWLSHCRAAASTTDPTQQNIGQQVGLGGQQTAQPANVMPSGSRQGASNLGPMMQISGGSVPFFIPPFKNPTGTLSHSHS